MKNSDRVTQSSAGNAMSAVDALIDQYCDRLKQYARLGRDLAGEFGIENVSSDPRVEAADWDLAILGGQLDDAMSTSFGVHAPVSAAFEPSAEEDVIDIIRDAGGVLAAELECRGFAAESWEVVVQDQHPDL